MRLACGLMMAVCVQGTASAALIEFTFGGTITNLAANPVQFPAPAPYTISIGDTWSLRYTFESATASVPGTPTPTRAFANALRAASMTIGATTSALPLTPSIPPAFGSLFQRADLYELQILLNIAPVASKVGIILNDPTAQAVGDPFVLLTSLSLASFADRLFYIQPASAGFDNTYRGTVTSFTPAPGALAVLPLASVVALRRRR